LSVEPVRSFREAVFEQPENLRSAAATMRAALAQADLEPLRSGTLVLSGIGASAHALAPALHTLRAAGRRAFAVSSAELTDARAGGLGDAFVLVSQSGASAETVDALAALDGSPVLAISARSDSPLAHAARAWLPLGEFVDTPVATLSYTATLQALGLLCDALLDADNRSGWDRLPELAYGVLERSDLIARTFAPRLREIQALDAVGAGPALASAGETALLGREALRLAATGIQTREYLHGPLEAVDERFACILFGSGRELALAVELASYAGAVSLVTAAPVDGAELRDSGVGVFELPRVAPVAAAILEILPVQLLVDHVGRELGLSIGNLRRQQQDTKVGR
jgi:glucosamine--fructose-6-phosphate aminotransferase (isomerizing)